MYGIKYQPFPTVVDKSSAKCLFSILCLSANIDVSYMPSNNAQYNKTGLLYPRSGYLSMC